MADFGMAGMTGEKDRCAHQEAQAVRNNIEAATPFLSARSRTVIKYTV
jgi:hypothetical protein